jgi:hypothetical protein
MSPEGRTKPLKPQVPSDIYAVLLIIAFSAVLATLLFVVARSYNQFGSLFSIP